MRIAWLALGALAALSACAPYADTYSTAYGYSYGSPAVVDGYYGAAPYYTPVPVDNTTIILGGDRRWDRDRWRADRDRERFERERAYRGRPAFEQPRFQAREAPRQVVPPQPPRPAVVAAPPPPPTGTPAHAEWSRRYINAAPSLGDLDHSR